MENELKSEEYIKGFVDALEFVVKSFRNIQFNSPLSDVKVGKQLHGISNPNVKEEDTHTKDYGHKDLIDKDYELCGTCMLKRSSCQCDVFNENGRFVKEKEKGNEKTKN